MYFVFENATPRSISDFPMYSLPNTHVLINDNTVDFQTALRRAHAVRIPDRLRRRIRLRFLRHHHVHGNGRPVCRPMRVRTRLSA